MEEDKISILTHVTCPRIEEKYGSFWDDFVLICDVLDRSSRECKAENCEIPIAYSQFNFLSRTVPCMSNIDVARCGVLFYT